MQAKFYIKKGIAMLLCFIVLLMPQLEIQASQQETQKEEPIVGYTLAESNGKLALYYQKEKARILVKDLENGFVWDSGLPMDQIPEDTTQVQKNEMESLFELTYSNANYFSSETTNSSLENEEYEVKTEKIKDGFAYKIYIPDFDFQVKIEYRLNEYGLQVKIPEDGIEECVQSGKQVKTMCQELLSLLQAREESLVKVEEDRQIPDALKKDIESAKKILEEMMEILKATESPVGIGNVSENMTEQFDDVMGALIGSSSKKGFYQKVLVEENIEDSVKESYRKEMQLLQALELNLKIKMAQLKEVPAITLVSVKLMPYFGAANDTQSGYMLYPDGCGAITYFKEKHGTFSSMYQADTYSAFSPDIDWEEQKMSLGLSNVSIPYFGIKNGDNACIAYVSNGRAQSTINFAPSGYVVNVNRIGAEFRYRQTVATSSIAGVWQSGSDVMVFEQEREQVNAELQYGFLTEEDATYSGMANKLRSYMEEQKILAKEQKEAMPFAIDLFGGYNEKVLTFDNYKIGTTFAQAKKIVESLDEVPVICTYRGALEEGFGKYPSSYKISKKLGSQEEIFELAELLKESGGHLYLESDQLLADYDQSGYTEGELTMSNRYQILNNDEKTQYLVSPAVLMNRLEENILPNVTCENVGLTERSMGSFVYADYSQKHESTRTQTVQSFQKVLETVKEQQGAIAVDAGNDYTFATADWVRSVPDDVSGYIYTDEAVPFYQMLVHGYLTYTTLPNNQFYNAKVQKLKAIEYGYVPYYTITAEEIDLGSTGVYVSNYNRIYEDMVETYNYYAQAIGDVVNDAIIEHKIDGNIVSVTYENGDKVIINYGDSTVNVDGIDVGPLDYVRTNKKEEVTGIEAKELEVVGESKSEGVSVYSSMVIWLSVLLLVSIVIFGGISFFYHHRS